MADFVSAFDPIARSAGSSPGFVWRLKSDSGHATVATDGGMDQVVNLSVWQDYASLHQFVYRSAHGRILLRRAKWFQPATQPFVALWWVPMGDRPTVEEALARLSVLAAMAHHRGLSPCVIGLTRTDTPSDGSCYGDNPFRPVDLDPVPVRVRLVTAWRRDCGAG